MQPTWEAHTTEYSSTASRRVVKTTVPMKGHKDDGLYLGRHRVVGMIASGGMGGVYIAEEPDGQRVALKVLSPALASQPDMVQRLALEREVSAIAQHDGVVRIDEMVCIPGQPPYLVMELLDGDCLGKLLDQGGDLEVGAIAAIGAQVADALSALHDRGVVHCDIKPDNIVILHEDGLGGWPRVKVIDFGVARRAHGICPDDEPIIAGTPNYMPPEQWRGEATCASDVYALGCMLFELITGDPPFAGVLTELAHAHMNVMPDRLRYHRATVPAALDNLVFRMLAKDPALRPRAGEVSDALSAIALALPPGLTLDKDNDDDGMTYVAQVA
jgi:serine/threonine protein kinase